tara:strand:+ start:632 stop:934 length:303 start_codon:yes stop_codon:yes gene_type:complete
MGGKMADIEAVIVEFAEEAAQNYLDSNLEGEVETAVESYMDNNFQTDEYVSQESLHHEISELESKIQGMIDKSIKKAFKKLQGDREYDFDKWEGTNGTDD